MSVVNVLVENCVEYGAMDVRTRIVCLIVCCNLCFNFINIYIDDRGIVIVFRGE